MTQAAKREIPRAYDPSAVEGRIYDFWNYGGYFTPEIDRSKKPFVVIMPPPNVTGELHMGHALTLAIEDLLVRWHRMLGDPTLFLPSTSVTPEPGLKDYSTRVTQSSTKVGCCRISRIRTSMATSRPPSR